MSESVGRCCNALSVLAAMLRTSTPRHIQATDHLTWNSLLVPRSTRTLAARPSEGFPASETSSVVGGSVGPDYTTSRRSILKVAGLLPAVCAAGVALPSQASRLQQDPRLKPLKSFWQQLVVHLQQQLSDGFAPNLVFHGPGEVLPSGTPGDPAAEYNKRAARKCGPLKSGFEQPYALCPGVPGAVAEDDTARDCCRHFAFAVPKSRYAFAAIDRQTSVVASARLALAAPATWQGILVHEMGHCIDFHTFPQRYQLPVEPPLKSASAAVALAAVDAQESDAELRADLMANALLLPLLGQQLCYDSRTRVQSLVSLETVCVPDIRASSGDPSAVSYMQHFPHPPVSS